MSLRKSTFATSKKPETEQDLLYLFEQLLEASLPSGWSLDIDKSPQLGEGVSPDLVANIEAPDGTSTRLLLEVKRSLDANQARNASIQLDRFLTILRSRGSNACGAVVAPYISPGTRRWLAERGTSFLDATGNARIACDKPAFFIKSHGADKNPWPSPKALQSLKGPSTGAAVRALVDFSPPYGVRELADRAGVSPATLSRVINLLEQEGAIERGSRGSVRDVDWEAVLRRWALDYSVLGSNESQSFLDPRGVDSAITGLRGSESLYALTGSSAVPDALRIAPIRLVMVYAADPRRLASELDLRPVDAGANVVLMKPFDSVVFQRQQSDRDSVALSQAAVDLMTGPGRTPSEAEELVAWMKEDEGAWRVPV